MGKYGFLITILAALVVLAGETAYLVASEVRKVPEGDRQACQRVVEAFCRAWMHEGYEAMYKVVSKSGLGKKGQAKFAAEFHAYAKKGGRLDRFRVNQVVTCQNQVLVKVDLRFKKEIPPRIVNGVHSFHTGKGEDGWKIEYIMPPMAPPALAPISGGAHPGGL